MYLEKIDDFQDLILTAIISMFIVLKNNMLNEFIVYLLFSCGCGYYGQICNKETT